MVEVQYQVVGQPLLTIEEAIRAGSFFGKGPGVLTVGDAKGMYCNHILHGFDQSGEPLYRYFVHPFSISFLQNAAYNKLSFVFPLVYFPK